MCWGLPSTTLGVNVRIHSSQTEVYPLRVRTLLLSRLFLWKLGPNTTLGVNVRIHSSQTEVCPLRVRTLLLSRLFLWKLASLFLKRSFSFFLLILLLSMLLLWKLVGLF